MSPAQQVAARQRIQAARQAEHVRKTIEAAPQITEQQLDRIAAALRPRPEAAKK